MKVIYPSDIQQIFWFIPRMYQESNVLMTIYNEQTCEKTDINVQTSIDFEHQLTYISYPFECGCSYLIEIRTLSGVLLLREKVFATTQDELQGYSTDLECVELLKFTDFMFQDGSQVAFQSYENQIFKAQKI